MENIRSKYKTKQRDMLLAYLKALAGEHITAGDVCDYCKEQGAAIGQSTVYRQLESLVDEGLVNKYTIDSNSPACFEYVGPDVHSDKDTCFHCRCDRCGVLIHLHCEELKEIEEHLLKEHGFKLNSMRTVFYGLCENCAKEENIR